MLTELRIRNLAIIDSVTLSLAPGFNVLTGETGAGKSIVVEALGLLIGERASSDMVRTGADKAVVEGTFDIGDRRELIARLDERGIESDGTLILKREVPSAVGGRARAWINGTAVTASVLAEFGRSIVNIHGQHEAQGLLDGEAQRDILDAFAEAAPEVAAVRDAYSEAHAARRSIAELNSRRDEAVKRADWLKHVTAEIGEARLVPGESERLEEEGRRLSHAEELQSLIGEMTSALEGSDTSLLASLGHLQKPLASLQKIDTTTSRLQDLYDSAWYALEELARESQVYAEGLERDPERLEELERRRDLIYRLCRKYGGTIESVITTERDAARELDLIDTAGLDIRVLEERLRDAELVLKEACARLSAKRRTAARRLARDVEKRLPDLGMPDGKFSVALRERSESTASGAEDIEFLITLNLGHDARPLSRIASGGELARVMLALKTILARVDGVPTLIFDEVDAGIGGRTGTMVGDAIRDVSAHHQVFVITHLAQIAVNADHHIVVQKAAKGGVTTSDITVAEAESRIDEIVRMLGGGAGGTASRDHARELLDSSRRKNRKPQRQV